LKEHVWEKADIREEERWNQQGMGKRGVKREV